MARPQLPKLPFDIPEINFERLISRSLARLISKELDLAGIKVSVNTLLEFAVIPAFVLFILLSIALFISGLGFIVSGVAAIAVAALYIAFIYLYLEFKIDARKTKVELMLPDYFQIVAANLRSGISLERAMLLAARPEFGFLSDDIKEMSRRVFGGQTLEASLQDFASRYRSYQLRHATRMIMEALRYGGAMSDLISQISRDIRSQQLIQKEVAGQLLMYSIFVAFAGLVAAPVLYGLTTQMIIITDSVWNGILQSNPGGLPTIGISFLRPSPPKITPDEYRTFSYAAILVITGFASLIMSAISTGSAVKGLRYLPVFIAVGLIIYFIVQNVIASMFSSLGTV
ncbi:MAG: type II secretion system F family protein [Candidatus Micrarchaeales archaeon]